MNESRLHLTHRAATELPGMSSGRQLGAQPVRSLTRARLVQFINSTQDTWSLLGKLSTPWNHIPESRGRLPF